MLARHVTEVPTINKTHYYFFLLYCLCHQFLLRTACPPSLFPILSVLILILVFSVVLG